MTYKRQGSGIWRAQRGHDRMGSTCFQLSLSQMKKKKYEGKPCYFQVMCLSKFQHKDHLNVKRPYSESHLQTWRSWSRTEITW